MEIELSEGGEEFLKKNHVFLSLFFFLYFGGKIKEERSLVFDLERIFLEIESSRRREENFLRKILSFFLFILREMGFFLYFPSLFSMSRGGSNRKNFFKNRIIRQRGRKDF